MAKCSGMKHPEGTSKSKLRGYKGLKSWMPTPVIIWEVHKTILWRPCSSSQFLLQDASWMSMCFWLWSWKSLDWISQHCRHTTIILYVCKPANPGVLVWGWPKRPAAPSQCHFQLFGWDHDLSRGTHDSEGCMKFIWSNAFGCGPIKCTLLGFMIPASALMALSYIDEARGPAGVSQKICSWDSISNWSHWEPSVAFAVRQSAECGYLMALRLKTKKP